MWHVYIIECQNGALYTGITQDINRRLREHGNKGSHFTSYNPIKKLLHVEDFDTRQEAEPREAQIKRWSRAKKLALIREDFDTLSQLSKSRD